MANNERPFNMIENYIYLYHIDKFIVLPTYPEEINDQLPANFNQTSPLSRSAPIFTYSNSGPRQLSVTLNLHRDMMTQINYGVSNIDTNLVSIDDDYVDTLVKQLQAVALPKYSSSTKMVNPPMVALRFGNEIYIKGVVAGGIGIRYSLPLLENNKYAQVSVTFTIMEVDPYDAETILNVGSFRGLNRTLERNLFKS